MPPGAGPSEPPSHRATEPDDDRVVADLTGEREVIEQRLLGDA